MTEHYQVTVVLTVYYLGMHTCPPKLNTKKYKRLVRVAVVRNSSLGPHAIQQAEVGKAVGSR